MHAHALSGSGIKYARARCSAVLVLHEHPAVPQHLIAMVAPVCGPACREEPQRAMCWVSHPQEEHRAFRDAGQYAAIGYRGDPQPASGAAGGRFEFELGDGASVSDEHVSVDVHLLLSRDRRSTERQ